MERRKIFNSKEDADALMAPGEGRQISPNELFFVTTRFKVFGAKRVRMGLVRVQPGGQLIKKNAAFKLNTLQMIKTHLLQERANHLYNSQIEIFEHVSREMNVTQEIIAGFVRYNSEVENLDNDAYEDSTIRIAMYMQYILAWQLASGVTGYSI